MVYLVFAGKDAVLDLSWLYWPSHNLQPAATYLWYFCDLSYILYDILYDVMFVWYLSLPSGKHGKHDGKVKIFLPVLFGAKLLQEFLKVRKTGKKLGTFQNLILTGNSKMFKCLWNLTKKFKNDTCHRQVTWLICHIGGERHVSGASFFRMSRGRGKILKA